MNCTDKETLVRVCAHEAGHIVNAWLSPFVTQLNSLVFDSARGARFEFSVKAGGFRKEVDDWQMLLIDLGGLTGEVVVFGGFRSGNSTGDLKSSRTHAERIVASGAAMPWKTVTATWHMAFERMFRTSLNPPVVAVLLEAYRKARQNIIDFWDAFTRASCAVGNRRDMTGPELDRLFGPRPWAGL